jgi:hypothetical protein
MRAPPEAVTQMNGSFCSNAHAAHEALADHRAHRAAHEVELERRAHHAERLDRALHHDQRIAFRGLLLSFRDAIEVLLLVLELERVDRQHLRADLEAAVGVEQRVEARPRAEALVVAALRADVEVLLQVGGVEHRVAGGALRPQALGHGLARRAGLALDLGRQQLLEPAHGVLTLRPALRGSVSERPSPASPRSRRCPPRSPG